MVIIKLQGGLGNQIFQYALGRMLEVTTGAVVKFDVLVYEHDPLRSFQLNQLNTKAYLADIKQINNFQLGPACLRFLNRFQFYRNKFLAKRIKEKEMGFQREILSIKDNVYLDGYWQSPKYFESIRNLLLEECTLNDESNPKFQELKKIISDKESTSIHFRRGDYVSIPQVNAVHGVCDNSYYKRALALLHKSVGDTHLFVFSDEVDWVKANFDFECKVIFIDSCVSDVEQLVLMSCCKHHIIANSSYSWWGAWLSRRGGIKIAPEKWFNNADMNARDIFPEDWVRL